MLKAAPYTLHRFELKGAQVRLLTDDVAVVAYQVHEELTVDGKPVTLDAADASTWVRREGGRCRASAIGLAPTQAQPRLPAGVGFTTLLWHRRPARPEGST